MSTFSPPFLSLCGFLEVLSCIYILANSKPIQIVIDPPLPAIAIDNNRTII